MQYFVIFAIIALVVIVAGGISFSSIIKEITNPTSLGKLFSYNSATSTANSSSTKTTQKQNNANSNIVYKKPAANTSKSQSSPNLNKIKIIGVTQDTITLNTFLQSGEKIDITGWKLQTGKRGEFIIPQGLDVYPGFSAPNQDIFVKKDDIIYIQSKTGPFNSNTSFRPNKCFGYLASYYGNNFPFSYSKICPVINRSEICNFNQDCQNFILGLQGCYQIDYSHNLAVSFDPACQKYIDNYVSNYLNYNGCLQNYLKDQNFLEKRWYIYAGYSVLCKCGKDTVYLYDKSGMLISQMDYEIY